MEQVSRYLYYMWNKWCLRECEDIWPGHMAKHVWDKWLSQCVKHGAFGGAATFWAELDNSSRKALWNHIEQTYTL